MTDCICNTSEDINTDKFKNSFEQLRKILQTEYFTPLDREDIYIIAIKLNNLYCTLDNSSNIYISPLLNRIKEIISLLESKDKNKFRNIFNKITEYNNIPKEEIILHTSTDNTQKIRNIIERCDETVIQIEYTILKNS